MSKLPRNRLDDTLNAILIAVACVALLTLTIESARDEQVAASAATVPASTLPAPTAVVLLQAPVADASEDLTAR